jgi:hypothetical protein
MVLSLAPVMLGFYELGGRTPLVLARIALTIGVLATVVFAALMAALAVGLVTFDEWRGATGPFAISAICMLGTSGDDDRRSRLRAAFPVWGLVISRRIAATRQLAASRVDSGR